MPLVRMGRIRIFARIFNAGGIGAQGAQQSFPGRGVLQQILHMQDQKTAVGPVQAARPDESEICDQRAHFRLAFHATQQVHGSGVVLHHHRRTRKGAVVHQQVGRIAVKHVVGLAVVAWAGRGLALQKCFGVFEHVRAQGVEIGLQAGNLGADLEKTLAQGIQQSIQHLAQGLALQVAFAVLQGFLGPAQLPHKTGHSLDQSVAPAFELEPHRAVQAVKLLFAQTLAFHQGVEGQAAAVVHVQVKTLVHGHRIHLAQQPQAGVLEGVHQPGAAFDVCAGFKTAGQFLFDLLHQVFKALLELYPLSGRQGQQGGAVRIGKIVHIDQIRRDGRFAGLRPQIGEQHMAAPQVRIAGNINVVALGLDLQGQVQGLHGAGLKRIAPPVARLRNLAAVFPGHAGGIKGGVQPGGGEGSNGGHAVLADYC